MKKVKFLQDRNPGVPGIVYKLEDEGNRGRKLEKVRDLWCTYKKVHGTAIYDLYSDKVIREGQFSLDHFVPWSYVTNDELWNLVPMDRGNNSSKGNRLPDWKQFFPRLVLTQYELYNVIFSEDCVRQKFEACRANNLNALWAIELLYIPGNSQDRFGNILEHNLRPIYEAAMLQGYGVWE